MSGLQMRELFGGAMQFSMPPRFQDVSDFRPVPDHQEVWADGAVDESVVIEIVEGADLDNSACAEFYFNDLAQCNSSSETTLQESLEAPATSSSSLAHIPGIYVGLAVGTQLVAKGSMDDHAPKQVLVSLAVVRLPQVKTDLLISLSKPSPVEPDCTAAQDAGGNGSIGDAVSGKPLLLAMLSTLQILDWGLFAAEET